MTAVQKTQDAAIEFAKDLLMHDFAPLLHALDERAEKGLESTKKDFAFHNLVVALYAARHQAENFRVAHVEQERGGLRAQMEKDLAEELRRVDALTPEEVAARRAS